eukprot:283862-Amphidinium_carterae.1
MTKLSQNHGDQRESYAHKLAGLGGLSLRAEDLPLAPVAVAANSMKPSRLEQAFRHYSSAGWGQPWLKNTHAYHP